MKMPIAALAVLAPALAFVLAPTPAAAQGAVSHGHWFGHGSGVTDYSISADSYTHSYDSGGIGAYAPSYVPSYSYWTAAYYGYPPRIYSGYGANDFPYYGRPYGSPSDPWSWPAMAGYASGVPTRYNLWLP
jgi:hypothetical protein